MDTDDKKLPEAVELEQSIIGGAMVYEVFPEVVFDILRPEMFYKSEHSVIWEQIIENRIKHLPNDIKSLYTSLKDKADKIGGAFYLSKLTDKASMPYSAEFHARIIVQAFIQRQVIELSTDALKRAYTRNTDVFDLLADVQLNLQNLERSVLTGASVKTIQQIIGEEIEEYDQKAEAARKGISPGVVTGFAQLDQLTGGWQNSDLVILAARPGMGKTSMMLDFVQAANDVAVFSLEMSATQLVGRMIIGAAEASSQRWRNGKLFPDEIEKVNKHRQWLNSRNIFIDDTPALQLSDLKQKARKLKTQHGIKAVFVDYLQILKVPESKNKMREHEVSQMSAGLKALAKELNVPIIVLAQMNRAVDARNDKRPQLSDLRESGAIEQDADMVMFIHRPDYYGMKTDASGNNIEGNADLIIAKYRHGSVGDIQLRFIPHLTKFVDSNKTEVIQQFAPLNPNVNFQHEAKKADPF